MLIRTLPAQINALGALRPAAAPAEQAQWLEAALTEPAPGDDPADIAEAAASVGGRFTVHVVEDGALLWYTYGGGFERALLGRALLTGPEAAAVARNYGGRVLRA